LPATGFGEVTPKCPGGLSPELEPECSTLWFGSGSHQAIAFATANDSDRRDDPYLFGYRSCGPKLEFDRVLLSERFFLSFAEKLLIEADHPSNPVKLVLVFLPLRSELCTIVHRWPQPCGSQLLTV
jgi:hypothetical protein